MKKALRVFALLFCASLVIAAIAAQQTPPPQQVAPASQGQGAAPASNTSANPASDGKIRILVTDSQSWEVTGGWGASNGTGGGSTKGGARPQTAEIIKTFNERCPQYTVTNNKEKANYAVILDHEGGKGALQHRNKIAVFNRDGDVIFSDSTRSLGNSVKDACAALDKDTHAKK
jgi:hypothetical protein